VLGHLERAAAIGTKTQRILDVAGAMLFRGKAVDKRITVLSGGERARLCLAGLLLGSANVLVLDEPGNHLDVETIDALAQALVDYAGTVIFTSHDRSFVAAVATDVIEVKDGRVLHVAGGYEPYLAAMNRAIDEGEAAAGRGQSGNKQGAAKAGNASGNGRESRAGREPGGRGADGSSGRRERDLRRELGALEKTIARLDAEKKRNESALLVTTDPAEAVTLHEAMTRAAEELAAAEERWLAIHEELGGA